MALRSDLKVCVVLVALLCIACDGVLGVCSMEHCTDPTTCVLSENQKSCKCVRGYYSDWCDKDAKIKVMCSKDFMTVMAVEDFFRYHNVPLDSLHLPNKSCRAQREVIDGVPFYMARIPRDQYLACGGKPLEKNITHAAYSLTLMSAPQVRGNIIRDPIIKIVYSCVYPYARTVSLPFPVSPYSSDTVMRVHELDAKVQMMLYTDHTYAEAFSSAPTIELRDKVYVEVKVTEPLDFFLLRVNECWATQSPQPNSTEGSVHTLLLNGCVNDETVTFVKLNVTQGLSGSNGESSTIRYSFDMFRFVAAPYSLYLHCTILLCEPDDDQHCKPNCKSITKREAPGADFTLGLLSYGPIRIEMPERSRSSVLTMVVLPVAGIWTMGLFLIILITVAKAGNRRLAQTEAH